MNYYRLHIDGFLVTIVRNPQPEHLLLTLDQAKASAFDRAQSIANTTGNLVTVRLGDRTFLKVYPLLLAASRKVPVDRISQFLDGPPPPPSVMKDSIALPSID